MLAPPLTSSFARELFRPIGLGHAVLGVAFALIWVHLLDAAFVHPQANATILEHVLQGLLALFVVPAGFALYPRIRRVERGVLALAAGLPAVMVGAILHLVAIIKNDQWVRTDYTGVLLIPAGLALLVLGVTLLTTAIPRRRYRFLMIPASIVSLLLVILPVAISVYITHAPRYVIHPQDLGAPYEAVAFETSDGLTLRGWYVPSQNGAAVAVMHGSGGARTRPLAHVRMLIRNGYGVLVFDVRGHGESDGGGMALGWGAHPDAAAAAAFLESRDDVEPGRVGLLGVSMGAEIAITSAAEDDSFSAIVADGPSGRTFADARQSEFPAVTKFLEYGGAVVAEYTTAALSRTMPPPALTELSPGVQEPTLYVASGTVDFERTLVSKIAERSGGPHELWVVQGAGHTEGLKKFPDEYEERVIGFLDRYLLD